MRSPQKEEDLTRLDNILVTRLDVQDPGSITAAVKAGIAKFGKIDVLVNNAGYGSYGVLEATPMEKIRRQFDVKGLSEALSFEMEAIGVKVKIVEPGAIKTDFAGRSFDFNNDESVAEYQ